ncbi:MAG: helix-turn-helix domain-containing protein [Oscillospiraceae bacterium]|nr:helix-turn-helix domain-containing protein [Oscillospiraceae bacterium]
MRQVFNEEVSLLNQKIGMYYRTVYICNEKSKLHCHDFYEVFLTLSDNIIHDINGKKESMQRGTLVFIRKDDTHCYEYTSNETVSFINLSFPEAVMQELFGYLGDGFPACSLLLAPHPPAVILAEEDILWFQKQLQLLNTTDIRDVAQLQYRCRVLLGKIFIRYFSKSSVSRQTDPSVPHWLSLLDQQMAKPEHFRQSSEHMVQLSGKCRAYLGRMVKAHYGKTIPEYINDIRLNYWANSLLTSDMPIIDLCYDCGFENVGWAYSLFKKKYGVSPLKYRKSHIEE